MLRSVLFVSALTLLTASALAQPDRRVPEVQFRLTGATSYTNISGHPGEDTELFTSGAPHGMLYKLSFDEVSDDPCHLTGRFWAAPDGASDAGDHFERSPIACLGMGATASTRHLEATYPDPDVPVAIHGIQVCHNDRNDNNIKLKGARILVSTLNRDGDLDVRRDAALAQSFERPNCREWSTAQRCPRGQVASGVRIYYHENTNQTSISGLALQCRAVEITRPIRATIGRGD